MTTPRRSTRRTAAGQVSQRSARIAFADPAQLDLDEARLRLLWRRVNEDAERHDQRAGEDAWDHGALLNEIAALGFDPASVPAQFHLGAEAARERMHLANATSRILAGVYGFERARLGLKLLAHYGLKRLEQLESVELPVQSSDGEAVRFPATREQLERAIEAIGIAPRA